MAQPRGSRTRERLLLAAKRALVAGDGDMVYADVAAQAGVSAGAPYRYFPSKRHLVVAVVEAFFDAMEEAVYRPTFEDQAEDWWGREQVRIQRLVDFFFDDPLGALIAHGVVGDAEVAQAQRRRLDRQARGAATNLVRGQELGFVGEDVDPVFAGAFLMGGSYQAVSAALDTVREGQAAPEAARRHLVTALTAAMARVILIREAPIG